MLLDQVLADAVVVAHGRHILLIVIRCELTWIIIIIITCSRSE